MDLILVPEKLWGPPLEALRAAFEVVQVPDLWRDRAALLARAREASALIVRNQTRVDAALLAGAPRLRVVGRAGVGLDNIDLEAATRAGIVVTFAPGASANAVAELTLGLMLALARRIPQAVADTRRGGWNRHDFLGRELAGRTLGIVGCGMIGRETARKAGALGMRLIGYDPHVDPADPALVGLGLQLAPLDELLRAADFVSCHLPQTPQTRGLFDARRFSSMRQGAFFVNTARGGIVDEDALADALASGHLGGAALDVRSVEPPVSGRLEQLPDVIATPHIGAFTEEAQDQVLRRVCEDVRAVLEGRPARSAANLVLPRAGGPRP